MDHPAVAIIGGTGDLGYGLALRLAAAGVPISIGSRDVGRAEQAAARAQREVPDVAIGHGLNADVASKAEIVIVAVPFANQAPTIVGLRDSLTPGKILLDATVPLETAFGGRPTRTIGVWAGSAAEQAQRLVPENVHVVSALHTVSAMTLSNLTVALAEDVLLCGDRPKDKARIAEMIASIPGLRPVDVGRLEMSRIVEQLTALMISVNIRHKIHAGIRITGLDDHDDRSISRGVGS